LVYCFEWPDNKAVNILNLNLENKNKYATEFRPDLLNGVTVIKTTGSSQVQSDNKESGDKKLAITAIPYYSWANRGPGTMNVWMKIQK
jgi:DUF1680 family protein